MGERVPSGNSTKSFDDAYLDYTRAVQGILFEVQRESEEANRLLSLSLNAAAQSPTDAYERMRQAQEEYAANIAGQSQRLNLQARLEQAWKAYLTALKAGWAKLDPATLDLSTLCAVQSSIGAAIQYALSTGAGSMPASGVAAAADPKK